MSRRRVRTRRKRCNCSEQLQASTEPMPVSAFNDIIDELELKAMGKCRLTGLSTATSAATSTAHGIRAAAIKVAEWKPLAQ